MNTEPIVIGIEANPADFLADAKKIQNEMDILAHRLDKAGVSQSAYNQAVKNATQEAKTHTMSITDMRSAYMMAADVARVVEQAWNATAGEAVNLANNVRSLRDVTGQSAEESSRLIQVLDDYKISVGDAEKATKKLATEGMEFNIQTIAKLSDEFLKLNPGVERTTFLYDNFGKSGDNFAEIMLQGSDAILAANDSISKNLILSDKQLKAARDYEKALDNTNDAILAYKVAIGNELLPVITEMATVEARVVELMEDGLNPYEARRQAAQELTISHMDLMEGMKELNTVTEDNAIVTDEATISVEDLTKASQDYLNELGNVTKDLDTQKGKLDEIREKYGEGSEEYAAAAEEFEMNTHRKMLAMLEEQLAIDGLSEKESTFLLEQGMKWGIYSQEAVDAMAAIQRQVDAMERNIDININVHTNYSEAGQAALTNQLAGEKDYVPNQHAAGGSFMVPSMYGNEGFRMGNGDTASAGELITITPANKNPNADIIAALYATRLDEGKVANIILEGMLQERR